MQENCIETLTNAANIFRQNKYLNLYGIVKRNFRDKVLYNLLFFKQNVFLLLHPLQSTQCLMTAIRNQSVRVCIEIFEAA